VRTTRTAPGQVFSYHGKHYQLEKCASIPRPARTPPIIVTGAPGDVAARLADLWSAGADTVYFHLYDVADLDHVRLLGREVLPRLD
jgi:alkanesulfonate monooxygenase SsuD/methylene tetrahydromethanopterin reductase-like flavin-dependent oxidoreductase (luciferase family)